MLRATSVLRKAAVKAERVVDTLALGHRDRTINGVSVRATGGLELAIALDKATVLNDGDALKLEDGTLVQIKAAPESLLEIRAENPLRLVRLAWHLGGNHVPAEMTADALYIPNDPALAELVRGQGCSMAAVERPAKKPVAKPARALKAAGGGGFAFDMNDGEDDRDADFQR